MGLEAVTICEQPLRGAEAVGDKGSLARIARGSDIKEKFAKTTTYRCERELLLAMDVAGATMELHIMVGCCNTFIKSVH